MDNEFWAETVAPKFANHLEFERAYKGPDADLSWSSGRKQHEEEFLAFAMEAVFGTRYDLHARGALQQNTGVKGFLDTPQIKQKLTEISVGPSLCVRVVFMSPNKFTLTAPPCSNPLLRAIIGNGSGARSGTNQAASGTSSNPWLRTKPSDGQVRTTERLAL
jgi:hypothetical protein